MRRLLVLPVLTAAFLVTAVPAVQAASTPLSSDVALSTHTVTIGSLKTKDLSTYPVLVHISGVSSAAAKSIAKAFTSQSRALVRPKGQEAQTSVEVNALVAEADRTYVSILFSSSYYAAGAAHPQTLVSTLVFQRSTGVVLPFASFFKDAAKAVPVLASEIKRNAKYALGPAYESSSVGFALATPTASELQNIVPRPWGLEVFFDQGDLAAEAFGPSSVLIPWKALTPLLARARPDLGGQVPSPTYTGGEAVVDRSLLKGLAAAVVNGGKEGVPGLTGRTPASYRLIDARRVTAYVSTDVTDDLYVETLVPFAAPSKPLSLLVALGGDEETPSFDVVDVQRGPVGCGTVSSAFIKALRERCPTA